MNKRQKLVQQRFLDNEDKIIAELKKTYKQSQRDIELKTYALQARINELQLKIDAATDEEQKKVLKSMQQAKIYQKNYQDALKKQIDGILDNMQVEEFTSISDYLNKCYEDGFLGTMYDIHGQGIPLVFPIDQEAMVRAVQLDSKINEGLYKRLGEDVDQLKKDIASEVSRGISTGASFEQIGQQIGFKMMGKYDAPGGALAKAMTIARTEGHRIQVQSTMDACYKAKEIGADVVKQWDSTMDKKTRSAHQKVDGEVRELDEPFSNGLMFPGDPNGGAGEVVNCRCALLQRARWAMDEAELETLKKRAEYFELDKADTFKDFKKTYLKAAEETAKMDAGKFVPAKTIKEAIDYMKTLGVSVSSDYKVVNIDVANMVNKELTDIYSKFGNLHEMGVLDEVLVLRGRTDYYAAYNRSMKAMVLNEDVVSKKTAISKMKKKAAEQKTAGFWSSGEAEHSIRHELGHAIDYAYIRDKGLFNNPKADAITAMCAKITEDCGINRWSAADMGRFKMAGEKLSYYALMNDKEFVAESVAEYMAGNPRETAKKVIDILFEGA